MYMQLQIFITQKAICYTFLKSATVAGLALSTTLPFWHFRYCYAVLCSEFRLQNHCQFQITDPNQLVAGAGATSHVYPLWNLCASFLNIIPRRHTGHSTVIESDRQYPL